ncbi:MAG: FecR domain-containing protein [Aliiglaciecola sp.]|uniref:FecR family protein n=1 Tax=Aliiglaciecola sp. TaxID=1872441 RepID=UPI003299D93C
MTGVVDFPKNLETIKREASEWIARMETGELSEDEQVELKHWVATSPEHKKQLQRLTQLWDSMSDIGERQRSASSASKASKAGGLGLNFNIFSYKTLSYFVLILVLPVLVYFHNLSEFRSLNGQYATKIGQQKIITLTDGSEILLNTNSIVEVLYSRDQRNIHLLQGEANFKVAADKSKPFTVKAGLGDVMALGTSFSVRLDGNKVKVLVSHGTVRIRAQDNEGHLPSAIKKPLTRNNEVIATAGNNVVFDEAEVESVVQENNESLSNQLSWKKGFLAFDNEPLSAVVEEVSRYTSKKIIILDDDIQQLKVGGYYPISNLESVFSSLELNLGLVIKRVDDEYYYITHPHS